MGMSIRQWTFRYSRHLLCVNCSEIPNSSKGGEMNNHDYNDELPYFAWLAKGKIHVRTAIHVLVFWIIGCLIGILLLH